MAADIASEGERATAVPGPVMRLILLVHRYLGVAVGVLMTLWCLSGFVMMYQAYPALEDSERRAGLAPLDLTECCDITALRPAPGVAQTFAASAAPDFRLEMLDGDPVLRLGGGPFRGPGGIVNLRTGEPLPELSAAETLRVAVRYGLGHGINGTARPLGLVDEDQWTVQSARRNQPVHHFAFDDDAGTEIYVSAASGEVFQDTNRRERVLTWLGAIPHWLYPLQLRRNGPLWTEIVIWTSVVGTFLAATGLYVGLMRFVSARRRDRVSPYRGWWYWHHVSGLVFGILALTWVFSGLLTMSPWGVFDGAGGGHARAVRGEGTWQEFERFIAAAGALPPGELVQIESAPFDGELHVIATRTDGSRIRLDASAEPAPLARGDVERAVAKLAAPVAELELLHSEDSYYYGHKRSVDLPVYRAILDDAEQTRLYIEATSGSVRSVDAARRASRWIRTGLHDLDFAGLRERPVWDVVVGVLLAGVTLVCGTGTWMAVRRVRADARRFSRRYRAQQRGNAHAPNLP